MTAKQIIVPGAMPSRDANGRALPGKLRFYSPGTSTPKTVYTSNTLSVAHAFPILSDSAGRFPAIWGSDAETWDVAWSDQTFDKAIATYSGVTTTADAVLASVALCQGSADAAAASAATAAANATEDYSVASAASATAAATSATAAASSATASATSATAAAGSATGAATSATAAAASAASAAAIVGFNPATRTISTAGLATGGGTLAADRTITVTKSSQAQAQAGTDDTTAMTPARTADAIAALGNARYPVVAKTASFTHTAAQNGSVYEFSGSLGAGVILTVAPATVAASGYIGVQNTGADAFSITASAGAIDGRTTIVVYPGERFLIRSDGTNLQTIGRQKRVLAESITLSAVTAFSFERFATAMAGSADSEAVRLEIEAEDFNVSVGNITATMKFSGAYASTGYSYTNTANGTYTSASAQSNITVVNNAVTATEGGWFRSEVIRPFSTGSNVTQLYSRSHSPSNFYESAGRTTAQNSALQGVKFLVGSGGNITGVARCYVVRE